MERVEKIFEWARNAIRQNNQAGLLRVTDMAEQVLPMEQLIAYERKVEREIIVHLQGNQPNVA